MNRRQIALKLLLDYLGMVPTMVDFDERLILQKAIYLIQQSGVQLGYHYSWYLRGPYSRDLTADAFANLSVGLPEGWLLDLETKEKLSNVKRMLGYVLVKPNAARELEKLASVLFVIKTRQAPARDAKAITARLTTAGKDFSSEDVDDAVRSLRDCWQLIEA